MNPRQQVANKRGRAVAKAPSKLLDTIITADLLRSQGACKEAVEAVEAIQPPLPMRQLAIKLNRADWLLWELWKMNVARELLVLCACDCAETARRFWPKKGARSCQAALDAARRWCVGKAPREEVKAAAADVYDPAVHNAAVATYSADAAVFAAANAASAAVLNLPLSATPSKRAAVREAAHRKMIRLILKRLEGRKP